MDTGEEQHAEHRRTNEEDDLAALGASWAGERPAASEAALFGMGAAAIQQAHDSTLRQAEQKLSNTPGRG